MLHIGFMTYTPSHPSASGFIQSTNESTTNIKQMWEQLILLYYTQFLEICWELKQFDV